MTTARRPPRMHARLRERRRAVAVARRRRRRRRALAVAGALALAGGAVLLARSPAFEVDQVEVHGADGERADQVHDRLTDALGTPLVSVDRRARATELMALPWVGDASLRRRPPGTLVAEVEPRQPIALVETRGGQWQVDADAVVVTTGAEGAGELVTVDGGDAAVVPPGERLRDDTLREAVAVVAALPGDLEDAVAAVDASRPRALALQLHAGPSARLGSAERLEAKLDTLRLVLADLADREGGDVTGIAAIDVRVPENPTVRRADDDPG